MRQKNTFMETRKVFINKQLRPFLQIIEKKADVPLTNGMNVA